jgi:hypothetical protein
VFIKVLYVVLVLCVGAVVGAAIAGYVRIKRHLKGQHAQPPEGSGSTETKQEMRN